MFIVSDFIIYIIIYSVFGKNQKEYLREYKNIIIGKLIGNFYSNLEYFPSKEIPEYIYEEATYDDYYKYYMDTKIII